MRLAKEMAVNLTVNEYVRIRVSKTRRGFIGLFRKKNEIPCEAYTNLQSLARGQEGHFLKSSLNTF